MKVNITLSKSELSYILDSIVDQFLIVSEEVLFESENDERLKKLNDLTEIKEKLEKVVK